MLSDFARPAPGGGVFFASRWVTPPAGLTVVEDGGLPGGFRAGGRPCGIKPSGGPDLALLVCDAEDATSAALFTKSGTAAPPVHLCRERCTLDRLRGVLVNSGNANAATGRRGYEDAARCQGAAAMVAGLRPEQVAVTSTGVIGVPLPGDKIVSGLVRLRSELGSDAAALDAFSAAIRTTDAFAKQVVADVDGVRIAAQAKGAGMIEPGFATMLCFVQSDAVVPAADAERHLRAASATSFDQITVDGQLSTNDTLLWINSGTSGVAWNDTHQAALAAILRRLALLVVADGEGAARVGKVRVSAADAETAARAARAVGNSPLVKTALHGGDPNWGRIVQAIGGAVTGRRLDNLSVWIEGVEVCARGAYRPHDLEALQAAVAGEEVEIDVALDGDADGAHFAEVFFSDFGHEYIRINAEYTT